MRVRGGPADGSQGTFPLLANIHSTLQSGPGVQTTWNPGSLGLVAAVEIWRKVDGGAFTLVQALTLSAYYGGVFSQNVTAGHTYQYQLFIYGPGIFAILGVFTAPEVISA